VPEIDLTRFVNAQSDDFERALEEIEAGRKRTHWMWYVFPQVAGLGASATSTKYAIENIEEAEAFLTHPVLGADYRRIVDAVWRQVVGRGVTIAELFGSPDDAKLVSSLTLFSGVARRLDATSATTATFATKVNEILQAAFAQGLARCTTTEKFLSD
jgi:uncharacterized protein (DUF1810 family)